jgi:hypothetical protein
MRGDRAMLGSPAYSREPNDHYATIDPRCIEYLDKVWPLDGRHFVEPMAGYGDLIWQAEACGAILDYAADLKAYPGADKRIVAGVDLFTPPDWAIDVDDLCILTNPPFSDIQAVMEYLVNLTPKAWVVVLMRANQLHTRQMRPLLTGGRLWAYVPLPFRPMWHIGPGESPRHEFAWYIWSPVWAISGPPRLLMDPIPFIPQRSPSISRRQWWKDLPNAPTTYPRKSPD